LKIFVTLSIKELRDSEQHHNHGKPVAATPTLNKYHNLLLEHGNTPFEYDETGVKPVRRLWIQLVHQESLMPLLVRFIFGKVCLLVYFYKYLFF